MKTKKLDRGIDDYGSTSFDFNANRFMHFINDQIQLETMTAE